LILLALGSEGAGTADNAIWNLPAVGPNHVWSYDFMSGRTRDGAALRILNVGSADSVDERSERAARSHSAKQDPVDATLMGVRSEGATPKELEALYRGRFENFLRVATAICHDQERGRDAVQSAFLAAVRNGRSFRGAGTLEAWVWRIVVNEARRAAREVEALPLEAVEDHAAPNGNGGPDPWSVRRWVSALPPRQREAVFLRYFADLDYRTIAHVLDLEPGTVSATLSAAHQTLRKRLEAAPR